MDEELIETLDIIRSCYGCKREGKVFILMKDFPWYEWRNGQLSRLYDLGFITKPFFNDNGVDIALTQKGWKMFDSGMGYGFTLTKDLIYEILKSLSDDMNVSHINCGLSDRQRNGAIKQLQLQGYIAGAVYAEGGRDPNPRVVWLNEAYITDKGREFVEEFRMVDSMAASIDLRHEFVQICTMIADGLSRYADFSEDELNCTVRDHLISALKGFGYSIADQTQQGISSKKSGELDIRITYGGIPIAIYEGLIHKSESYLFEHIDKAICRYNQSGCKDVYVVEFSKNVHFDKFWDRAIDCVRHYEYVSFESEFDTKLSGVRMIEGSFEKDGRNGMLHYIGVNCFKDSSE